MPEHFTGTDRPSWVTDWRTLHRVADRQAPTVERAFVALVAAARGGKTRRRIQRALQRGNRRRALTIAVEAWQSASETWRASMEDALRDTVLASATAVGTRMSQDPRITFRIAFRVTNPAAQRWAETQAGRLIRRITADQRQSIRRVIVQAFTENLTTRQVAIRLTEQIGLQSRQAPTSSISCSTGTRSRLRRDHSRARCGQGWAVSWKRPLTRCRGCRCGSR